jgi:formate dehydrogenase major subunit
VVIPGTGFASTDGTFTNTERRLQIVQEVADDGVLYSNWEVAQEIARIYEVEFPWEDTDDISLEMEDRLPSYKYAEIGEVFGGVLTPVAKKLVPVEDGKFADIMASTDNLLNMIAARLPDPQAMPIDRS